MLRKFGWKNVADLSEFRAHASGNPMKIYTLGRVRYLSLVFICKDTKSLHR